MNTLTLALLSPLLLIASAFAQAVPPVVDISSLLRENPHGYRKLFEGAAREGVVLDWDTLSFKGIGDTAWIDGGFSLDARGVLVYAESTGSRGPFRPKTVHNARRASYPAAAYRITLAEVDFERHNVFTLSPFAGFANDSVYSTGYQYVLTDASGREIGRSEVFRIRKTGSYDAESGVGAQMQREDPRIGVKRTGELLKLIRIAREDARRIAAW